MQLIRNANITTKLSALTLLAVSVSLSLCFAVFLISDIYTLRLAKRRQLEALAMVLGENTISAIEFDDRESATETLTSLAKLQGIEAAVLYDGNGSVFATFPADLSAISETKTYRSLLEVEHPILYPTGSSFAVSKGTDSGDVIGKVVILANTNDISNQITSRTVVTGAVLFGSLIIGFAISWYFRRSITTPVNDLVDAARYITDKDDYSYRARKHGDDEIGVLADAFNGMLAEIQAGRGRLQQANNVLEQRVEERTAALERVNSDLQHEMTERASLQDELMTTSRLAGMAEVATGVLHNVGNVLNSVNVSANLLIKKSKNSRVSTLAKVSDVISEQKGELAAFLTTHEKGKHFPRLLEELSKTLSDERDQQLNELRLLIENIEHVKEIISMQQTYARVRGTSEQLDPIELIEDALRINDLGLHRHRIDIVREYSDIAPIVTERHKVLQILINLITNAKHALCSSSRDDKQMTLVVKADAGGVCIQVQDNGVGILQEHMTKIFAHGFTTKKQGHGFGLHSSALAAQELGGALSVCSDGPEEGATFTLRLPAAKNVAV